MGSKTKEEEREYNTEYKKLYRLEHPEYRLRQNQVGCYANDLEFREHNKERKRLARLINPVKVHQAERRYRQTHPDIMNAKDKRWRIANRFVYLLSRQISVAKRLAAQANAQLSDFSKDDWLNLLKEYNYSCAYCHVVQKMTIDHVIPLSLGGNHTKNNIVPACRSCNTKKWIKPVEQFKQELLNSKEVYSGY